MFTFALLGLAALTSSVVLADDFKIDRTELADKFW